MAVPILKQGSFLIASIQSALTDTDLVQLRDALVGQVGSYRSRGVIVDVTALDVLDSFASRTLRDLAHMVRLRGAETVIRSEEHTSELQSRQYLVCRLLLEKKKLPLPQRTIPYT